MLPMTITKRNALPWLALIGRELASFVVDKVTRRPSRVHDVLKYVKENATRGDPQSVLDRLDEYGRSRRFLMNVGDVKGKILDRAVRDSGAGRALEIGAFCGYSAIRIARLLDGDGSQLFSIEISEENAGVARHMVEFAGLADRVTFMVGGAEQILPGIEQPFDLVFIDHMKDLYYPDLRRIEECNLLRQGSIVVADNVGMFENSVADYLNHVRTSGLYESVSHQTMMEYHDIIEDVVEVSVWKGAGA